MKGKLIFTDIDGTLVGNDMKISFADKTAIAQTIDQGAKVYLATGRKYAAAKMVAQDLHPDVQIIASNGSVYDYAGEIFKTHFTRLALETIYHLVERKNASVFFFGLSETYYNRDLPDYFTKENQARLISEKEKRFVKISSLDELGKYAEKIVNGIIISENDNQILEEIRKELLVSENVSISSSNINNIELMPKGISKAAAIQALQKKYGIGKEDTIAFGDGVNDIEMFNCAKYSVAMENAPDSVKAHASYQTLSNKKSGISHFLNKLNNK